jgi:hypothetical protein
MLPNSNSSIGRLDSTVMSGSFSPAARSRFTACCAARPSS